MTLTIRDLTPEFGAAIDGIDPSAPLSADDERVLQRTFDERGLLVMPGLLDLDASYQAYLASTVIRMVDAAAHGEDADAGEPYLVSNRQERGGAPYGRLLYHSDMMWSDNPFEVLTLYGLDIEEPAVPTTFVSAAHAWDTLPDDLRARVDGLYAIHETGQQMRADESDGELLRPERERVQSVRKPLALTHPRTGRTLLYVCQMMTRGIDGLPPEESEALLGDLFDHLYDASRVFSHQWHNGDLVMWDNLAMQHARANVAIGGPARTLRKVTAPKKALDQFQKPRYSKIG